MRRGPSVRLSVCPSVCLWLYHKSLDNNSLEKNSLEKIHIFRTVWVRVTKVGMVMYIDHIYVNNEGQGYGSKAKVTMLKNVIFSLEKNSYLQNHLAYGHIIQYDDVPK